MIINGNNEKNVSLRTLLIAEGFNFPCGGKGICGKCRIIADSLAPTSLDRKFLSDSEISRGIRLACDKILNSSLSFEPFLLEKGTQKSNKKLENPEILAVLSSGSSVVSIIDGTPVETLNLPSVPETQTETRAVVGKNSVELFEKYGVARADTIMVIGDSERITAFTGIASTEFKKGDIFSGERFDMPSDTVYIAPLPLGKVGSDVLASLLLVPENYVAVYLNDNPLIIYKGAEIACSVLYGAKNTRSDVNAGVKSIEVRALLAALKFYKERFAPSGIIIADDSINEVNSIELFAVAGEVKIVPTRTYEAALSALSSNRYRTRLDKLSTVFYEVDLIREERFQDIFARIKL